MTMDVNNLPTTMFDAREIQSLKETISQSGIVFEAELIKAIEETTLEEGAKLDPQGIIKMYVEIATTAEKVNPRTGEMIADHETRMKALDKITNIMLGKSGASKGVTVNIQANTQNLFQMKIPEKGKHLIH